MKTLVFLLLILQMADLCDSVSVTFLDMYVKSEGCEDRFKTAGTCGIAYIKVQKVERSLKNRGHNVVVANGTTGAFIDSKSFDTENDTTAGEMMRDYLNSITGDKIVLIATQESASNYWHAAYEALKRLGATDPILSEYRSSFAFIGYAGEQKPFWITQEQEKRAEGQSIINLRVPLEQGPPANIMNVSLRSEGCEDPGRSGCGRGYIIVNDQEYSVYSRGFNVAAFSEEGVFLESRGFDTHKIPKAGISAANFLNSLSGEKIVLVAVGDEASVRGGPVLDELPRLGAYEPIVLEYRSSFALAGYAGSFTPPWIRQAQALRGEGPSIVTTTIEPVVDECAD